MTSLDAGASGTRVKCKYRLLGVLGAGATATVHLGALRTDARTVRPVAIKRLHPHIAAEPRLRDLLVEEARVVARISHPNVVGVLDITRDVSGGRIESVGEGAADAEVFLVLEYVHGVSLAELLQAGPLPPPIAAAIAKDILAGLHAAHHVRDPDGAVSGIVHRDITPRNVVVTDAGSAKILDFGIAKARARLPTTRDGHIRGSLPYMAPEQLTDEALGPRTDLYAAAVVFWEMLTGGRLFSGESDASIIKRILDHAVVAPSEFNAAVPSVLDGVVLRGLARSPAERFRSGLEMALAIDGALATARPPEVAAWLAERMSTVLGERGRLLEQLAHVPVDDVDAVTLSSSRSDEPAAVRRRRGSRVALATAVAAMISLLAWAVLGSSSTRATSQAAVAPMSSSMPTRMPMPLADPIDALTVTSPPLLPQAAHPASASPPTAASSAPAGSVVARPTAHPPARAKPRTPDVASAAPPSTSAAPCVPYYVDEAGVRRFNRECLSSHR